MSEVLLEVDKVSKRFCRSLKRSLWYGLQDLGSEFGGRGHGDGTCLPQSSADVELRQDEFWAVKDVSFTLSRGECVSVIGQNGAGKTTLLKIINGLIRPDCGRIQIQGSVRALIALNAGFNPVLTGRENIYIQAAINGIANNQITHALEEIIDFAGINDFIDSPVQNYSSGMVVRLGFAIASQWFADILLLDEVLAVGDVNFRNKCYNKLASLKNKGASFLLVTHDMSAVSSFSDRCILLSRGKVKYIGKSAQAISLYESENMPNLDQETSGQLIATPNVTTVEISTPSLIGKPEGGIWKLGHPGHVSINLSEELVEDVVVTYIFRGRTLTSQPVTTKGSCKIRPQPDQSSIGCKLKLVTSSVSLPPGSYTMKIGIWRDSFEMLALIDSCPLSVEVDEGYQGESTHYQSFVNSAY